MNDGDAVDIFATARRPVNAGQPVTSTATLGQALEAESIREALHRIVATGDLSGIPERLEPPEPRWVTTEEARRGGEDRS